MPQIWELSWLVTFFVLLITDLIEKMAKKVENKRTISQKKNKMKLTILQKRSKIKLTILQKDG